jgi:hypothetical protein
VESISEDSFAIFAVSENSLITISDSGMVIANGENSIAIFTEGNVSITGGTVAAERHGCAILAEGKSSTITVSGGTVESTSNDSFAINATSENSLITVSDSGMVIASGENSIAILTEGNVSVTGGTVAATAERYGYAIVAEGKSSTIMVSGGTVESAGNNSFAIFAPSLNSSVTISKSGMVTACGENSTAILTEGDVTMTGGTASAATGIAISATNLYIKHGSPVTVTSTGNNPAVELNNKGSLYVDNGELTVNGSIATELYGVYAINGAKVTVEGNITAQTYIRIENRLYQATDFTEPTTKPGYRTYTDGSSSVWVRAPFTLTGAILYQPSPTPATITLLDSEGDIAAYARTTDDGSYTLTLPIPQEGALLSLEVTKPGYLSYTVKNLDLADWDDEKTIDIRQLAGDVNGDGIVNAIDLTQLLSEFNREPLISENADIDGNGIVNAADLTYLLAGFNKRNVVVDCYLRDQDIAVDTDLGVN